MVGKYDGKQAAAAIRQYRRLPSHMALRIYTSRLLGSDPNLVLHGGGNTSVKLPRKDILGKKKVILFVKGSGIDLATITPAGFTGLNWKSLSELRALENLTDAEMENQLLIHKTDTDDPDPSVEALLHAFLPYTFVDHTHADSILVLSSPKGAKSILQRALGTKVAILPYLRPGLPLAKAAAEACDKMSGIEAIVFMHHGIFTFGDTAKQSYNRMSRYVNKAELFIKKRMKSYPGPGKDSPVGKTSLAAAQAARVAQTIRGACAYTEPNGILRRFCVETRITPQARFLASSKHAKALCESGAITPDHVTRTKNRFCFVPRVPDRDDALKAKIQKAVDVYQANYHRYFKKNIRDRKHKTEPLDPFPRVFVVAHVGIVSIGYTRRLAQAAADIATHSLLAKHQARSIGTYQSLAEEHIFDMEYWGLQLKKVAAPAKPLQGQIALVTGAGGAIGFGIADRLLAAGAVVALSDIDATRLQKVHGILAERYGEDQVESMMFDVTNFDSVVHAFDQIGQRLGGLDILVPNAGIAYVAKIENLPSDRFRKVIEVNLMGTFHVMKAAVSIFRRQETGGSVVVISSKNVPDPGASFGAYSASKAGAHQISKIAALELAELGVSVNMVNPDAVFGDDVVSSGLWDLVGPDRMKSRGLDPEGLQEYYRQRNLLKVSVRAEHVGNVVVFFASNQTPTTGASLPVDGGVPSAFPR